MSGSLNARDLPSVVTNLLRRVENLERLPNRSRGGGSGGIGDAAYFYRGSSTSCPNNSTSNTGVDNVLALKGSPCVYADDDLNLRFRRSGAYLLSVTADIGTFSPTSSGRVGINIGVYDSDGTTTVGLADALREATVPVISGAQSEPLPKIVGVWEVEADGYVYFGVSNWSTGASRSFTIIGSAVYLG